MGNNLRLRSDRHVWTCLIGAYFLLLLLGVCLFAPPCRAEEPIHSNATVATEADLGQAFAKLAIPSGYIFSGTVLSVQHNTATGPSGIASTQVTFHIDEAYRGVQAGQNLTIKEWAALWQGGEKYRPGERVLLFLYPPSKLGFTSPVGQNLGRFNVDSTSHIIIEPGRQGILRSPLRAPNEVSRISWDEFTRALVDKR